MKFRGRTALCNLYIEVSTSPEEKIEPDKDPRSQNSSWFRTPVPFLHPLPMNIVPVRPTGTLLVTGENETGKFRYEPFVDMDTTMKESVKKRPANSGCCKYSVKKKDVCG